MKDEFKEHAARFDEIADEYDEDQKEEYLECVENVIDSALPRETDIVLDIGTGTGAVALNLADKASFVYGRDISTGMLEKARKKAEELEVKNVDFDKGSFLEPGVDEVDIVVTNFALHHLSEEDKEKAIAKIDGLGARKVVIGDLMFFRPPDQDNPFHEPDIDNPSYVGFLVKTLTDAGYVITDLKKIHREIGVIVAEKIKEGF